MVIWVGTGAGSGLRVGRESTWRVMCGRYEGQTRSIRRSGPANTSCGAINNISQNERGRGKTREARASSVEGMAWLMRTTNRLTKKNNRPIHQVARGRNEREIRLKRMSHKLMDCDIVPEKCWGDRLGLTRHEMKGDGVWRRGLRATGGRLR